MAVMRYFEPKNCTQKMKSVEIYTISWLSTLNKQ